MEQRSGRQRAVKMDQPRSQILAGPPLAEDQDMRLGRSEPVDRGIEVAGPLGFAREGLDGGRLLGEKGGNNFRAFQVRELFADLGACPPLGELPEEAVHQLGIGGDQLQERFVLQLRETNLGDRFHVGGTRLPGDKSHLAEVVPRAHGVDRIFDPLVVYERYVDLPAQDDEHGITGVAAVDNGFPGRERGLRKTGDYLAKVFR